MTSQRAIPFSRTLSFKLILSFLFISVVGTGITAILARKAITESFSNFMSEQDQSAVIKVVTDYYAQNNNSFVGLQDHIIGVYNDPDQARGLPPLPLIVDLDGNRIASRRADDSVPNVSVQTRTNIPIRHNQQTIAYIIPPPGFSLTPESQAYLAQIYTALFRSAIAAVGVALILGVVFARRFAQPIKALTEATQNMTQGQLAQQVDVTTQDEIGNLGRAFNQMSAELAQSNGLRKQMTADIAHDLRNPLLVLNGYIESLRDEVLAPTPERFEIMHQEVQNLSKLVDDLRTLSLADSGELKIKKQECDPQHLLEQSVQAYQQKAIAKDVILEIDPIPEPLPMLMADNSRLLQALNNLVSNALRYVAAESGRITLSATKTPTHVNISVEDNGEGIPTKDLDKIFDRFYRVDSQRSQDTGQSGLGLAIARSIIEAHHGTIRVSSSPDIGTKFDIAIPR